MSTPLGTTLDATPGVATLPAPSTPAAAFAAAPPLASRHGGLRLVQLHDGLARVTRESGEVVGYVEAVTDPLGERYRAKRFLPRQRRFAEIGEFWSRDDAVDCFRFA